MKKILSIVMVSILLLTGVASAAVAGPLSDLNAKRNQAANEYKTRQIELKPLIEEMNNNRKELLQLRADVKIAHAKAKARIKEMIKNKNLTPQQIEAIKAALNTLKESNQALAGTTGDIASQKLDLGAGKRDKNFAAVKVAFEKIINIQNSRIDVLKKTIENLNALAAL